MFNNKEERLKAVRLLIKYDMMYSKVIKELGYPSRCALRDWYYEYLACGDLHDKYTKKYKYSDEDKRKTVDYYIRVMAIRMMKTREKKTRKR